MNFTYSFEKGEKKKIGMLMLIITIIFWCVLVGAILCQMYSKSEAKILIWVLVEVLLMFKLFAFYLWLDRKTWMISINGGSISFCNRWGRVKTIQISNISKVVVNQYGRIRLYGEEGKVFLTRNVFEYPGMVELIMTMSDRSSIFEYTDEEIKVSFWDTMKVYQEEWYTLRN